VDNGLSGAWAAFAALCLPVEELKNKHGVELHCSPNRNEIRLTAAECTVVITRGRNEISAVMHEPNGRITKRNFSVQGGPEYPQLIEGISSSSPKRVVEVFEELMAWVKDTPCLPSGPGAPASREKDSSA